MHSDMAFAFQILVGEHSQHMCYMTGNDSPGIETLQASFSSQFSDFKTATTMSHQVGCDHRCSYAALVYGVPKQIGATLNGLTRFMVRCGLSAMYEVWATAKQPTWLDRYLAGKRYSSEFAKAQRQESAVLGSRGSRTITRMNADARTASERNAAVYRRMSSDCLLDCRILLAFWGKEHGEICLRNGLSILLGAMSQEDRHERMKYKILQDHAKARVLEAAVRLDSRITGAMMLPSEAFPFFEMPTVDIGLKQSSPAAFTIWPPIREHEDNQRNAIPFVKARIALGRALRDGCLTQQVTYLSLEDLRKHTAILGMTGSGKTTTKNRIVIDAWKNGAPSFLIEPAKTDARALMGAIPDLRVFTVGLEHVAPIRLNPFFVEDEVRVQLHIDLLHSCFMSAWPMYGILANHLRRVLLMTYARNGWDVLNDLRGKLVTPEDFLRQAESYSRKLRYGSQLKQDFRGAILTRAEELCDPSRAAILNAQHNLSTKELLSRPTVIELCHIGDPDFRAFLLSLLLVRVYEHFTELGPAKSLRNLLVVDEAHSVLEELPRVADTEMAAASRRKAVDQLIDLIAEARSPGLGTIIADQNATRLARDALKTCCTKIVHRLTSPEGRGLLALETGCNPEQREHIDVLGVGEVVMRGPQDSVPSNVVVFHDPDFHPAMLKDWKDEDVIERMKDFYEKHPELARTPDIPVLDWSGGGTQDHEALSADVRAEDIVQDEGYARSYLDCIKDPEADSKKLVEELVVYYVTRLEFRQGAFETAQILLDISAMTYGQPHYQPDLGYIQRSIMKLSGEESTRCST